MLCFEESEPGRIQHTSRRNERTGFISHSLRRQSMDFIVVVVKLGRLQVWGVVKEGSWFVRVELKAERLPRIIS
jgi:hypothetical protein